MAICMVVGILLQITSISWMFLMVISVVPSSFLGIMMCPVGFTLLVCSGLIVEINEAKVAL